MWIFAIIGFIVILIIIINAANNSEGPRDYNHYNSTFYRESSSSVDKTENDIIGEEGEKYFKYYANIIEAKFDSHIFSDIIIQDYKRRICEIDYLIINSRGIFVLELKNWAGDIYGKDDDENWEQLLGYDHSTRHTHHNPIRQNQNQVNIVKNYLELDDFVYGKVVFLSNRLGFIESSSTTIQERVSDFIQEQEQIFTKQEVLGFVEKIKRFKDNPIMSHEEYVMWLNQRYNKN